METIAIFIAVYAIGMIIGYWCGIGNHKRGKNGVLIIDKSMEDKDRYKFELNVPLDELETMRYLSVRITEGLIDED